VPSTNVNERHLVCNHNMPVTADVNFAVSRFQCNRTLNGRVDGGIWSQNLTHHVAMKMAHFTMFISSRMVTSFSSSISTYLNNPMLNECFILTGSKCGSFIVVAFLSYAFLMIPSIGEDCPLSLYMCSNNTSFRVIFYRLLDVSRSFDS